jgi:hypothetical protein
MSRSRIRAGKKPESRELPEDVRQLIDLLLGEIRSPSDMQKLLDDLPPATNCLDEAIRLLKAKDRAGRREAFIKTEPRWFRKYGWFMARVVILFGLLVLIFAILARGMGVDFFTALILGAAVYYALLVTLSNLRYRDKNRKRLKLLEQEAQRYQREVVSITSSLFKRFHIDPSLYPIANPRSAAGLEAREDGYYIPPD